MANKKRPVNLDIATFKLPVTAYVSILHRVSGVANVFISLVLIWLLGQSLANEESFNFVRELLDLIIVKALIFLILSNLIYHLCAGLRHLVMDMGLGEETFFAGRVSAILMITIASILVILAFVWIFL